MWSDASVAHTTPVREDLDLILTQTQEGIFNVNTLISLLSDNRLKPISFISNIVISSLH
jgi:hypothetical protein